MARPTYKIGEEIAGGFRVFDIREGFLGVVYLARKTSGDRAEYRAFKTLRHPDDEVDRELFAGEVRNWTRLPRHPNIVGALGVHENGTLLELEFVRGPCLRDVARRRPLHPVHFLSWAIDITRGLRFLHEECRFLHRDLRPANILIDIPAGLRARISDLGIGKPFDPEVLSHTVIGTYTYMAPEVHEGRTDFRSDIFSLGATLYYMLTGEDAVRLTTKNLREVRSPRELVPEAPEPLARLILRAVAPNPEDRPNSAAEIEGTLREIEPWPAEEEKYGRCLEHGVKYFLRRPDETCPFCRYEAHLREMEARLEPPRKGR